MMGGFERRPFGETGRRVSALGLGSSLGLGAHDVERAFDRGIDFYLWGSLRRWSFGRGLRAIAKRDRENVTIAVQSYTRIGGLMEWSLDRALSSLRTDYVDVLCLAWWNQPSPRRIVDAALALQAKGKVRHLMVSCHHRPTFEKLIADPAYDAIMVRYNAAHPGAEREVFPHLATRRAATVSFTATRWGTLLDRRFVNEGEVVPRAPDCYRFALSNPSVDVCLSAPKNAKELDEAFIALEKGPLDEEELAWMRRVGAQVRDATAVQRRFSPMNVIDRLVGACGRPVKELSA